MIGKGEPKYLNSPETDIFKKGQEVYGLWEGREAIRKAGRSIVCEGYMDVIQLSQAGFGEAVAALGTAIGEAHIRKLFKIVPQIIFSFDGDDAGRHAARRALEQALLLLQILRKRDLFSFLLNMTLTVLLRLKGLRRMSAKSSTRSRFPRSLSIR